MVISCDRAFGTCPQGIMRMCNLVNLCEVFTFCTTPTQQLKTMDQAERMQESECESRARAEETPKQKRRGWQGEEKKIENAEQELEPKKHLSREIRGWQDNSRENAEQELQLGCFFGSSFCLAFSLLLSLPCQPLFSLLSLM